MSRVTIRRIRRGVGIDGGFDEWGGRGREGRDEYGNDELNRRGKEG